MEMLYKFVPKLNNRRSPDRLPTQEMGTAIPKTIHQTYSHVSKLPPALADNIAGIKALNPGWTHILYNDVDIESFILQNYGDRILQYYHRIDAIYGAARADLFRYLLMYKKGGVYLDVKSSIVRPLDETLLESDRYLLSQWHNGKGEQHANWGLHRDLHGIIEGGEFQQWFIACVPGHPFLKAVIENVLSNIDRYNPELHGVGKPGVLRVTGPIAYTLAIVPLLDSYPHRRIDSERSGLYLYPLCRKGCSGTLCALYETTLYGARCTGRSSDTYKKNGYSGSAVCKKRAEIYETFSGSHTLKWSDSILV